MKDYYLLRVSFWGNEKKAMRFYNFLYKMGVVCLYQNHTFQNEDIVWIDVTWAATRFHKWMYTKILGSFIVIESFSTYEELIRYLEVYLHE